jgi:hypothetical protein
MRKQLGIGAFLLAAFGAPAAIADVVTSYTIAFTGSESRATL